MKEVSELQRRRAVNQIWNAAKDYSFVPDFKAYDGQGNADLYWNSIIGAVRRHYEYPKLAKVFAAFQEYEDGDEYEALLWLGLENAAYAREREDRPVLRTLREDYANRFLKEYGSKRLDDYHLYDYLATAHYLRALGREARLSRYDQKLLDELEFGQELDTDEIVERAQDLFQRWFQIKTEEHKRERGNWLSGLRRRGEKKGKGRLRKFKKSRFLPRTPGFSQGCLMPLILFKIKVVLFVLAYMFLHMLVMPFVVVFRHRDVNLWVDKKIQAFARFCMKVLKIDLEIDNQAILSKVDWTRPVFVMGNHNSYADIPIIFLAIERTIGFIAKAELRFIPFLGFWMHRIGCVLINREKRGGAALIREAMAKGKAPRLFIFPEGTRGKDENMVPFKSGGFRLAIETEATILPIYIKGSGFAWEHRKSSARCKVTATVLEPLDVKALAAEKGTLDPRKDVMHVVRERMEAAV